MTHLPTATVYCRFTHEAFTVLEHFGAVVTVRDAAGNVSARIVGDLTSRAA